MFCWVMTEILYLYLCTLCILCIWWFIIFVLGNCSQKIVSWVVTITSTTRAFMYSTYKPHNIITTIYYIVVHTSNNKYALLVGFISMSNIFSRLPANILDNWTLPESLAETINLKDTDSVSVTVKSVVSANLQKQNVYISISYLMNCSSYQCYHIILSYMYNTLYLLTVYHYVINLYISVNHSQWLLLLPRVTLNNNNNNNNNKQYDGRES